MTDQTATQPSTRTRRELPAPADSVLPPVVTAGPLPATKVVATLGPASKDPETLERLLRAGVEVVRINCSHGDIDDHLNLIRLVGSLATKMGVPVAVLADLQGPKLRVGDLPEPVKLENGDRVLMRAGARVCEDAIPVVYPQFAADLRPGDRVLLHDGLLETRVEAIDGDEVTVRVERGGLLRSRKGINMPGVEVSASTPTDQDVAHLHKLVSVGVDYVALSFVKAAADVQRLREVLTQLGSAAHVVAKLERAEALENLEEILDVVDAVMVARGDLGVEIGPARVPVAQKRVIETANARGVPVITATEMLESMITSPRPTRAEAADVANAVFDGTDAVMLSAETAVGQFPVEAVEHMRAICAQSHAAPSLRRSLPPAVDGSAEQAVTKAVRGLVVDTGAVAVVCFTETGTSARLVAAARPGVPVLALTANDPTVRRCALYQRVRADKVPAMLDATALTVMANDRVQRHGLAGPGDVVVVVAGTPGRAGRTNRVFIHQVDTDLLAMLQRGI